MLTRRWLQISSVVGFILTSGTGHAQSERLHLGTLKFLRKGPIQSFIGMTESRHPNSIGVFISASVLTHLPDIERELELDLPKSLSLFPYDPISLTWHPKESAFEIRFILISRGDSDSNRLDVETSSTQMEGFSYSFYEGNITSLNLWIRRELLDSKTDKKEEITPPFSFKINGFYPKSYSISYDHALKQYRIALEDLEKFIPIEHFDIFQNSFP